MRTTTRLSLIAVGLAALLATPAVASSQTFYSGLAGGLEGTYPGLRYFTAQASIGRRISRRFEARVDAFFTHWDDRNTLAILCVNGAPPGFSGIHTFHEPERVAGLTLSGIFNVAAPFHGPGPRAYLMGGVGAYCLGGVGAYCFSSHDSWGFTGSLLNMRLGLSTGVGGSMPMGPRARVFVEARFHYLLSRGNTEINVMESHFLLPLTLGVRF